MDEWAKKYHLSLAWSSGEVARSEPGMVLSFDLAVRGEPVAPSGSASRD